MTVTFAPAAGAVPPSGSEKLAVDLPKLTPEKTVPLDADADADLNTAPDVPVEEYAPASLQAWAPGSGSVDPGTLDPGETQRVGNLPVALGVPAGADPAKLAGDWQVALAAPGVSQTAGVPGLVLKVTPPPTADPTAQVALSVDYTAFGDLYGPEAADRFGLVMLPNCVYDAPDSGDCVADPAQPPAEGLGAVSSDVVLVPAKDALTKVAVPGARSAKVSALRAKDEKRAKSQPRAVDDPTPNPNPIPGTDPSPSGVPSEGPSTEPEPGPAPDPEGSDPPDTGGPGDSDDPDDPDGEDPEPEDPNQPELRRIVSGAFSINQLLAGPETDAAGARSARSALAAGESGVVGAMDTGASAGGDYTATPLQSSGSWAAGSSSGAFTYAYQVNVPETAGGLMPKVSLSYSSQSVDGRTSATNNQASWIGDGWDYSAGAITRTYANCRQDSKKAGSNNATHRTGDLCWGSDNATLSLGGSSTELVWNGSTWTTANGDGSKVELKKDASLGNGDNDNEYWIVTTRDGTQYFFGKHKLPGWTAGKPVTNSVLTVPVYGNHPSEDCYKAAWKDSFCQQAWRWALDYVQDVHGNAMSLWWARETNHYARNFNFKAPVPYHRAGYLDHIEYGQRADGIFSAAAPATVQFHVAERCYAEAGAACTDANFASTDPAKFRPWYDTPADLHCVSGKKCWNAAPSFFSRKRLDRIVTSAQRTAGSAERKTVDSYQLKQSFPKLKTGPNTALWLESIARTGYDAAGATAPLNPVKFEANPENMPNRVADDNRPGFARLRVSRVINEYGGETVIRYQNPASNCRGSLPGKDDTAALRDNNRLCYPVFWHPDAEAEEIDWFHKYVVKSVEELPNVDGVYSTVTEYAYDNARWRLAEQEFTKKATRTYSEFAGFSLVTVYTGADDSATRSRRTKAVTRYFQGLSETTPVKDAADQEIAKDREAFAGRVAEELTYLNAGDDTKTGWLTRSVNVPNATQLASRNRDDGLSPLRAWRVTETRQLTYTRSSAVGDDKRTLRTTDTRTTFDDTYGLPTLVEALGDTGVTGDESCAKLEYQHHTGKHLIGMSQQVRTSPTTCAAAKFDDLTTLSGLTRTGYDAQPYGTALSDSTRGLATQTWSLKADGSGVQLDGSTAFDAIGRVVSQTDPDNNTSTISYEPSAGQAFRVVETNSAGHRQIKDLDPGRALTTTTTDANDHVSQAQFDPLGRMTKAWAPGRATTLTPDFQATYDTTAGKPPTITTRSRGHESRLQTSVTIFDGLGRERQTQEPATGDGRLITDTLYNRSGEIAQTNNAYFAGGGASTTLFTPLADTAVPNATRYTYDGLGRVLTEMPVLNGTEFASRATRYEYGNDYSMVVNPNGASSYRVFTDALGRSIRADTFTSADRSTFTSMRYHYDLKGRMDRASHSADPDHPWTWSFDQRNRVLTAADPDSGSTTTSYDQRDRPQQVTDQRGVTVWNGYDKLSRPAVQRLGNSTGALLAEFTYDSAPGGKGMPATATRYTDSLAYKQSIGGYTEDYQPTSTKLELPASIAQQWGLQTSYQYTYSYTDTGLPQVKTVPAVGSFASEQLIVRYTADGKPLSVSGKDWYGSETSYSPYGQVLRSTLGSQPYRVWTYNKYDPASGALDGQEVYREKTTDQAVVTGNLVSRRSLGYDDAGNVTSVREESAGIAERQCFRYDPVGQLKTAWTSANQTSCGSGPTGNVAAGADKSGYWQEYEYDLLGNRKKLVEKNLAGDSTKDATSVYTYGKTDGTQPRTLTKVEKNYTSPTGVQIKAEAARLYELTGETKSVTDVGTGDSQAISWTYDGKVDRIAGQGAQGKSLWTGLADKCIDLQSGLAKANQPIQLYACNNSLAQKWAFTATGGQPDANLGTLAVHDNWCVQPAANTAGSAAQIRACDGTAGQQLIRTSDNRLKHKASGLCLSVQNNATTDGTPLVLAACDTTTGGSQVWRAQSDSRHIYAPDGSRVLSVQAGQATLYLGEAQVTVRAGGSLVNTQRTYPAPGGMVTRYQHGTSSASTLIAVTTDHQGTPYAEVSLTPAMSVRIRKQDPFGNERGNAGTLGANMQTEKGFLGANRDDQSGFVPLGARWYDPEAGRFLSADPVLDLADPAQNNGYTYSHNNPVTHSDPSGLSITLTASERAAALAGAGLSAAQVAQSEAAMNTSLVSVILGAAWGILSEILGINDAMNCFAGDLWACGSLILGAIPWGKIVKLPKIAKAINATINAIMAWRTARKAAEAVLAAARAAERVALAAKKAAIERAKRAAQAAAKKAAEQAKRTSDNAVNQAKKTGNPVQKQAQGKANPKGSSASGGGDGGGGGKPGGGKPGGETGASSRSSGGSTGSKDSCENSFVPGTRVLMADGTTKAIKDVKPGDKVRAIDPRTGRQSVQTVSAAIRGEGTKKLVTLTVKSGAKDHKQSRITATDNHPFWVPELREWVEAGDLKPGSWLRTSAGTWTQISAVSRTTAPDQVVHNLTVANIHTYYVMAGDQPVLAHNCGGSKGGHSGTCECADGAQPRGENGHYLPDPNKPPAPPSSGTHGNSKNSPLLNYLYVLEGPNREYIKIGITNNPGGRYSAKEMADMGATNMIILTRGSRQQMLDIESYIFERWPGPENHEVGRRGKMSLPLIGS